jgi:hypothetical protein
MPLYPIENTENLSGSYARIECNVAVDFTEEIDAELLDRLDRAIHFEIGMLVSFILGNAKSQMSSDGSSGVCEVKTRALMPAAAIAEYYRELADQAEADDDDPESGEAIVEQVRKAMEAWSKKPGTGAAPIANEGYAADCESYIAKHDPSHANTAAD